MVSVVSLTLLSLLQSFKYLKNKPIAEMSQTAQFLHILEAEKNLLVNVFITLSPEDIQRVEDQLYDSYKSNAYSDKAMAWNEYRRGVIKRALRDGLVPLGTKWVKEWLHNESEDATAAQCGAKLEAVSRSLVPLPSSGLD
jgi:transcription elongation factor SPT6